jgi:hypothetical protein
MTMGRFMSFSPRMLSPAMSVERRRHRRVAFEFGVCLALTRRLAGGGMERTASQNA